MPCCRAAMWLLDQGGNMLLLAALLVFAYIASVILDSAQGDGAEL